jgi:hypothetical protein
MASDKTKIASLLTLAHGAKPITEYYPETSEQINAVTASITEYKARCARNGICPNDSKPCKYYRNCVLERSEACLQHTPKGHSSHSTVRCNNCKHYPGDGVVCNDFVCMTAYRGR